MSDPPKLDYLAPRDESKPVSTGFQKGIGLAGALLYGALSLLFAGIGLVMFREFLSPGGSPPVLVIAIVAMIWAFCSWRAVAAFRQLIH